MEGEIDNMNPCAFPLLFSPLQVGSMTVKNRIFMSAMSTALCDGQNQVTEEALAYYSARARGGEAGFGGGPGAGGCGQGFGI